MGRLVGIVRGSSQRDLESMGFLGSRILDTQARSEIRDFYPDT